MIAIPALDLSRGSILGPGAGGERAALDAPRTVRDLVRIGFSRLHVVDLDAATGRGSNDEVARELVRTSSAEIQLGGGLREAEGVRDVLEAGATWAVVAARAIPHIDLIADLAHEFPGEVILSVALRGRRVDVEVWPRSLPLEVGDLAEELGAFPLAAILLRALEREGSLAGPDMGLVEDVVEVSSVPVLAAGGIGSIGHLRSLEERGVAGAVMGTALLGGSVDPVAVASEFAA